MAKQGMKRPETEHHKSVASYVPEIQGKAKSGKTKAPPIISSTHAPSQKVFHTVPFEEEKPISNAYKEIDNDLARDNLENDLTAADMQDM